MGEVKSSDAAYGRFVHEAGRRLKGRGAQPFLRAFLAGFELDAPPIVQANAIRLGETPRFPVCLLQDVLFVARFSGSRRLVTRGSQHRTKTYAMGQRQGTPE